jgi:hypothetical protein
MAEALSTDVLPEAMLRELRHARALATELRVLLEAIRDDFDALTEEVATGIEEAFPELNQEALDEHSDGAGEIEGWLDDLALGDEPPEGVADAGGAS